MKFDIATIVHITSIIFITQTIAVFLQYKVNKTYHGLGWWLSGAIFLAAGFFLMPLIRSETLRIFAVFGNPFVFTGLTLLGTGFNKFFGIKESRWVTVTTLSVFIVAYLLFIVIPDYDSLRAIIVALATSVITLRIAATLFLQKKPHYEASALFTAFVFLAYGLFQAVIVFVRIFSTDSLSYEVPNPASIIITMFLVPMVCSVLWTAGFIIMVNQRLVAENRELFKQLEREKNLAEHNAHTDNLTSLANRRLFDDTLQTEFNRLKRFGKPLSLIMLDIDYFKNYNDTYGHQAGDNCLRQIGSVLRGCVKRLSDTVARYGGEEFVIILPETDKQGALSMADNICNSVRDLGLVHASSEIADCITISAGIVTAIPADHNDPVQILAEADAALYQAKKQGRNCIVIADDT